MRPPTAHHTHHAATMPSLPPTRTRARSCCRDEYTVPPNIQAAVDSGDVEEAKRLLTPMPEGMSKAMHKKLIKNAEIAAKRVAKGKSAQSQGPAVSKCAVNAAKASAAPGAGAAAAPAPPSAAGMVAGADEQAVVAGILTAIESLALPEETLCVLREQQAALCNAIAPQINTLRNNAYTDGFTARVQSACPAAAR